MQLWATYQHAQTQKHWSDWQEPLLWYWYSVLIEESRELQGRSKWKKKYWERDLINIQIFIACDALKDKY